jgi:nitroreductase
MDAIYARRSIRRYERDPVPREQLLEKITEIHPFSSMLKQAPAAIMVCGDLSLEKYPGSWVQDCPAATQNIRLEIAGQGYGGVWLGVNPFEDRVKGLQRLCGLPASVAPLSLLAMGKPAEKKEPKDVFLEPRVRFNRCG